MMAGLEIWQHELQQLRLGARDLSSAMTSAAAELRDSGAEPTEALLQQMQQFRADFRRLREYIVEAQQNGSTKAVSLHDLDTELQRRQQVAKAIQLIDRAAGLRPRAGDVQGAMFDRLKQEITQTRLALESEASAPHVMRDLESGRHPLMVAVRLAEGADELTDDAWGQAMETVTTALGRDLATALARGRLMIGEQ
jgi:nanoRNase/pAp phosphatase (c-di-AMP/oligoRNAs hydrolase)